MKGDCVLLSTVFLFTLPGWATLQICQAQEPYKLGVQENVPGQPNSSYSYPAPQTIPSGTPSPKLYGKTTQSKPIDTPPRQETFSAGTTSIALPPVFLGVWRVHGERAAVEALPEFQEGAERSFALHNDQIWNISGNPNSGYTLGSNTGITTPLFVAQVQGSTAIVRYQHPVGNTMAQEAIVMRLAPGGMQFDGLERISIVKEGLSQPRAKVTYNLSGVRQ